MKNLEKQYIDTREVYKTKVELFKAQLDHTLYLMEEILDNKEADEEKQFANDKKLEVSEYMTLKLMWEVKDSLEIIFNKR